MKTALKNPNNGNTMLVNKEDVKFYLSKGYVMTKLKTQAKPKKAKKTRAKSVSTKERVKDTWSDAEKADVMLKSAKGLKVLRNWFEGYHEA